MMTCKLYRVNSAAQLSYIATLCGTFDEIRYEAKGRVPDILMWKSDDTFSAVDAAGNTIATLRVQKPTLLSDIAD